MRLSLFWILIIVCFEKIKVMEDKHRGMDEKPRGNIPLAAKLGALATIFPSPSPSLFFETAAHSSTFAGLLQAT